MLPAKEMTAFKLLVTEAVCLLGSLFFLGRHTILSGVLSGIFISLTSLFFLLVVIKKYGASVHRYSWGYFVRSFVVRLIVAGALLFLFICLLKVNTIGIVVGLLAGLIINTVFLTRLRAAP